MRISLKNVKEKFNPIYWVHMLKNKKPVQIYYGGSSSGKSHGIAQRCVIDVLKGRNYLIARKTKESIRKSVFNEIVSKIYEFRVKHLFDINKSDMVITCRVNQSQIIFVGLDDVEKVKSVKPIRGVITDIWIEEATETSRKDYKQLDKRLRGKCDFVKRITLSFNPILKTHWIYSEFFIGLWEDGNQYCENERVSILKTTYRDNLFLTEDDIARLLAEKDEYYIDVYLNGNWGTLKSTIFRNWHVEDFDIEAFDNYRNGVDWGFADDPFAYVRLAIDKARKKIWICAEIYRRGLLNEASAPMVKAYAGTEIVRCDSAEPKSVADFKNHGVKAISVKKGPGSVESGIKFLQGFEIIVHTSCINTAKEYTGYVFKEDKEGEPLPQPVDKNNHLMDAVRYAIEDDIVEKKKSKALDIRI